MLLQYDDAHKVNTEKSIICSCQTRYCPSCCQTPFIYSICNMGIITHISFFLHHMLLQSKVQVADQFVWHVSLVFGMSCHKTWKKYHNFEVLRYYK